MHEERSVKEVDNIKVCFHLLVVNHEKCLLKHIGKQYDSAAEACP